MTPRIPTRCPCDPEALYARCCGPLHAGRGSGRATARTAEQLMRSRYSAFAVGDAVYLLATWHPSTRPPALTLEDPDDLQWRRLEVHGGTAGTANDDAGTVTFTAHFWDAAARTRGAQSEDSAFVREDGQWFYVGPAPTAGSVS